MTDKSRADLVDQFLSNLTRRPFSRLVLLITMAMTWRVTQWAFEFANATTHIGGYDVAATLVAITGPFAALQAAAFKVYTENKE